MEEVQYNSNLQKTSQKMQAPDGPNLAQFVRDFNVI